MNVILIYFLVINFIGLFLIWYDKSQAKKQQYRISENTLLSIVFVGGMIGSGFAMITFRHKTSKTSYLWKFFRIIFIQIAMLFGFLQH